MARFVSLSQLRADAVSQADLVSVGADTFITTTELDRWIVQSSRRWLGMLLGSSGTDRYLENTNTVSVVAGQGSYLLPDNFFQLYSASVTKNGSTFPIYAATIEERARADNTSGPSTAVRPKYVLTYGLLGVAAVIQMVPTPQEDYTVTLRYAPTSIGIDSGGSQIVDLGDDSDGDRLDGVNGWEQWIVFDVCMKAKMKQEEDFSGFKLLRDEIGQEITRHASERDRGPKRVRDTYRPGAGGYWPGDWY